MKVKVEGQELNNALQKVVRALPIKHSNPILDTIKLVAKNDKLTMTATDLELCIESTINVEIDGEFEIAVNGKLFADYIKKIADKEITLEAQDETQLNIINGTNCLAMNCLDVKEFPVAYTTQTNNSFEVSNIDFKGIIGKVINSVATDEGRPSLRGVCLDIKDNELTAVGSDGYRLALATATITNNTVNKKIIVPAKSIAEFAKINNVETIKIYVEDNYIMIESENTKVITRLIAEDYINYQRVIPTNFKTFVAVDKKELCDALERIILVQQGKPYTKLTVSEKNLEMTTQSDTINAKENVDIVTDGEQCLTIGFNSKFLNDAIKNTSEEIVKICMNTPTSPAVIKGSGEDWLHLVLPLRVL